MDGLDCCLCLSLLFIISREDFDYIWCQGASSDCIAMYGAKEIPGQCSGSEGSAHKEKGQSVFLIFEQLLLLSLPGAGSHPGFNATSMMSVVYSHLWWRFWTQHSTQILK